MSNYLRSLSAGELHDHDRGLSHDLQEENYLRGVQVTDAKGWVEFTSIFPAAYSGRWPHVHFEVYPSLDDATSGSGKLRTSQLALPEDVCAAVYEVTGSNDDGYVATLNVPV